MDALPALQSRWTSDQVLAEGEGRVVVQVSGPKGERGVLKAVTAGASAEGVARLRREALLWARLRHPALPALLDAGERPRPWFVVAWAPGRDPRHLWTRPPISAVAAAGLGRQLADVVGYLHHHGVAHRDLKPANLKVDGDRLWLLDLGSAAEAGATGLTREGDPGPATPQYAPPEWFAGGGDAMAADVYAVGQIVYEWLTGGPAFPRVDPAELAARKGRPLDPEQAPNPIRGWVARCTAADPRDRPSAREVALAWSSEEQPPTWTATATLSGAPPTWEPERPDVLGRYLIQGVLGRGGMGVVYRAHDPVLHRDVALKMLAGPSRKERFFSEVRTLARLRDPGIVTVLDAGEAGEGLWFAMELVEGPDLATWLAQHGPAPPAIAAAWVSALARALVVAHAAGVVHRDVKPANVLLDRTATGALRPRLADFGVAAGAGEREAPAGTPRYMAPEQRRGETADPRSDLYGLGKVLEDLLRGGPGDQPPEGPPELLAWVRRLTAEDPAARPASAAAVAEGILPSERRRGTLAFGRVAAVGAAALGVALVLGAAAWWASAPARVDVDRRLAVLTATLADLRARGDEAGAQEALRVFTVAPDHQGARALARAWLAEADRRHAARLARPAHQRGLITEVEEALATAFAVAHHPDDQEAALAALVTRRGEDANWEAASRAMRAWADRSGSEPSDQARAVLRRFGPVWAADLPPAWKTAAGDHPWARGTRIAQDLEGPAVAVDVDQDGHLDVLAARSPGGPAGAMGWIRGGEQPWRWRTLPGHPDLPRHHWLALPGSPFGLVTQAGYHGAIGLWRVDPDGVVPIGDAPIEKGTLYAAAGGTLAGVSIAVIGTQTSRRLRAATADSGGAAWVTPHPETEATNSEVQGIAIADLDDDGRAEVVVGTSAWGAWDLRVFQVDDESSWTLVDRRPHGAVEAVGVWRRGAGQTWIVASARGSGRPDLQPEVVEPGLHAWRWDPASGLVRQGVVPWTRTCDVIFPLQGFKPTLAARCEGTLLRVDEALRPAPLPGPSPVGAVDLDGDGTDEVLAWVGGDLWLLGSGTERVPDVPAPPGIAVRSPPPGVADPSAWARAEALVAMGLVAPAAQRLEQLAVVAPTAGGGLERLRAGELWLALSDGARALAVFEAAASDPHVRARALALAVEAAELEYDLDAAARLARDRAAMGDPGDREAWAGRADALDAARDRVLHLDPSAPLATWEVPRPLSFWRDAGSEVVRLRSTGPAALLARHPVTWEGGPVTLSVELVAGRMEWGQGLSVGLVGANGESVATWSLVAEGGGGETWLMPYLRGAGPECIPRDPQIAAPGTGADVHLFGGIGPGRRTRCRLETPGFRSTSSSDPIPMVAGPYAVEIRSWAWHGAPGLVDVDLVDVAIGGVSPLVGAAGSRREAARLAIADGRFAEASGWLGEDADPEALALRSRIAVANGDSADARRWAARAVREGGAERHTWFATLERSGLAELREGARTGAGDAALTALHAVYDTPTSAHPSDEALESVWTGVAGHLRDSRAQLDRAEAYARRGLPGPAAEAARLTWAGAPSPAQQARLFVVEARLATGPEAKVAALARAIATSPTPEVTADRIAADPAFAELRDRRDFRALMQARFAR